MNTLENSITRRGSWRQRATTIALLAAAIFALSALINSQSQLGQSLATTPVVSSLISKDAQAATVRSGSRFLQVDVLLDGVETQRAATSAWGAATTCWSVATAGATAGGWAGRLLVGRWVAAGAIGGVAGGAACVSVVSVCAAQAYYARRWAGITVTPTGFFCWKY